MAGTSTFPSLTSSCRTTFTPTLSSSSSSSSFKPSISFIRPLRSVPPASTSRHLKWRKSAPINKIRAVAEETLAPPEDTEASAEQPVTIPVSPSDMLTMFFQAEGAMSESAIPNVAKALEEIEGVSDLNVQVLEGIASVELTKQTTVQATGVASNLVEIIQGAGFKLQSLNLSFEDEEDTKS